MADRHDEKDRLWKEVLGKNRTTGNTEGSTGNIELTLEAGEEKKKNETLLSANAALSQLNEILQKQKKELEILASDFMKPSSLNPNLMKTPEMPDLASLDVDELETSLQEDYGVEKKPEVKKDFDSAQMFDIVSLDVSNKVIGQPDAIRQLLIAFRRPYVMGSQDGKPKNVILVTGPRGSGRHEAIMEIARSLYGQGAFLSSEVSTIDLSRYTSGAQEQIFLQDLYEAIQSKGSIICFENFETGFPGFLRMVDSLATTGSVTLSKRYVAKSGVLVENQTGLVKDAVESLSCEGKYLVFITSGSASKVQDSFGANFMYHVLDTATFKALDEESIRSIINSQSEALAKKCKDNLRISFALGDAEKAWIAGHFDKTLGTESITGIFYDFYVSLSHMVLNEGLGHNETVEAKVENDLPVAVVNGKTFGLSRSKNSQEEIDSVNKELDQIVGLEQVKGYIRSLQSHVAIQQKRREQGMKTASLSMHMIFTGNPGTGKTTIARLISRYMKAIGALTQGQLVEVTRADLVAQYVGQTAPLTMSVIKSAIGGVLFIDEAYSLYRGKDDAFGLECIDTIVKAMEDNRENLIVILAGYSREMSVFLESNSGLKSRFPNLIHFPDYTGEELRKIAAIQARSKGYEIAEEAFVSLEEYFNKVQSINAMEAGNGRLARNVVEDAILRQASRIMKDPDAKMTLLLPEDFDLTVKVKPREKKEATTLEELLRQYSSNE